MAHEDPAEQLTALCEQQQQLMDSAVKPALEVVQQHAASSARFLHALVRLARYKMDVASADEELGRAVCAAVRARAPALALLQPEESDADSDALLRRLREAVEAARSRVSAAEGAMPTLEQLPTLHEDRWGAHAAARDEARREQVHLAELLLEGLLAKQHCLQRSLRGVHESAIELPALDEAAPIGPTGAAPPLAAAAPLPASPLLAACGSLGSAVLSLAQACGSEARARAAAIAARIVEEHRERRPRLERQLREVAAEVRAVRRDFEAAAALHERRVRAEAMLESLKALQAEVVAARKRERTANNELADLRDEAAPGDEAVWRQQEKCTQLKGQTQALLRRRDGVVAEVAALSATPLPPQQQPVGEDTAVPLDFPELPVRAHRIVQPGAAYETLDEAGRQRFDVEVLLRRAGLLACDRSYESYSDLAVIAPSKPNVKCAVLRGVAPDAAPKILKEFGVSEFRRIKRAVAAASRLHHPGVVPVECAFLIQQMDIVVVQSPRYVGGNLRQWCGGKPAEARLRAAQRVAEAVRFLHAHGVLHRDLKPENVVVDGNDTPALCDFDLSLDARESITSTQTRGTLLYLAPDARPSPASDVFALGVTLLDLLFCDGDEERLRQLVLTDGRAAADLSDLERVRRDLSRRVEDAALATLVGEMISPQPADRPTAEEVAARLGELLHERTCCLCLCPAPPEQGLECDGAARHFACDECFSAHVQRREALAADGLIKCAGDGCGCRFTLQAVAKHATTPAFDALRKLADDMKVVAMQREFEQWKDRFEAEFAAKSESERRVLAARRSVEEMMALQCPKCRGVFAQFDGCAALKCGYEGCGANFCAFCLADCGADAHPHVRTCRLNPKQNEYFVSEAAWQRVIRGERERKLLEYWGTLEREVKDALAADASIRQIIRDLRLEARLGVEAFEQQLAQLHGMGFNDERAMRRALREAGGDVAAAVQMLVPQ